MHANRANNKSLYFSLVFRNAESELPWRKLRLLVSTAFSSRTKRVMAMLNGEANPVAHTEANMKKKLNSKEVESPF